MSQSKNTVAMLSERAGGGGNKDGCLSFLEEQKPENFHFRMFLCHSGTVPEPNTPCQVQPY